MAVSLPLLVLEGVGTWQSNWANPLFQLLWTRLGTLVFQSFLVPPLFSTTVVPPLGIFSSLHPLPEWSSLPQMVLLLFYPCTTTRCLHGYSRHRVLIQTRL